MTIFVLSVIGVAALGIAWVGWAIVHGGAQRQTEDAPVLSARVRAKRTYMRSICPYCGEMDIPVRRDGEPVARWHLCLRNAPATFPPGWPGTTTAPAEHAVPATNDPSDVSSPIQN